MITLSSYARYLFLFLIFPSSLSFSFFLTYIRRISRPKSFHAKYIAFRIGILREIIKKKHALKKLPH